MEKGKSSSTVLGLNLALRGGGAVTIADPNRIFNTYFGSLVVACAATRIASRSKPSDQQAPKSAGFLSLQRRFLAVFWAWKFADWLHGPYFYEVYASKVFDGKPMGPEGIARMFLCGFGSSMLFGTFAGSLIDTIGRRAGCMAFAAMYVASALSTRSSSLPVLVAGRVLGGTVRGPQPSARWQPRPRTSSRERARPPRLAGREARSDTHTHNTHARAPTHTHTHTHTHAHTHTHTPGDVAALLGPGGLARRRDRAQRL